MAFGLTPQRNSRVPYSSAGKSGDQRGASAREDIMDTVISLRRPREYSMTEGARFEVHLTKARSVLGDDAEPFDANLVTEDKALHWQIKVLEDVELEELKPLLSEGYSIRDCTEEMGNSKGTIQRLNRCTAVSRPKGRYSGTSTIFLG